MMYRLGRFLEIIAAPFIFGGFAGCILAYFFAAGGWTSNAFAAGFWALGGGCIVEFIGRALKKAGAEQPR